MAGGIPAGRLSIEIVAEVARLQADMDKVKRAVKDASNDIAKSAKAANDNLAAVGSGIAKAGNTSKLAGHHVQNLAFQFQDLGVQLLAAAQSSAPLKMAFTALVQQGTQINGIMSQAGIGIKGLIAATAGLVAPFVPFLAVLAAAAGGVALLTSEINENSKVTVTWSDTLLGAWDALSAALKGELASAFDAFGIKTGDVWSTVVDWAKWAANRLIGLMTLVPRTILENFKLIPAGVADIFLSAVNMAIDAINKLLSSAVNGVNGFVAEANQILSKANLTLPTLTAPQIARLSNDYAGAAAKLGKGVAKSLGDTIQRDFIGELADKISPFAQARAVARLKKDAQKAGKEAGAAAAKAAKDAFDLDKFLQDATGRMVLDVAEQLAKRQEEDWAEFQKQVGNMSQARWDERMQDLAREQEAVAALNDQYRDLVNTLGNLGGAGAGLGTLFGILTGNTSAVGGKFGNLLNIGLGTEIDSQGNVLSKTLGTELSKVFKKSGEFGKLMTSLVQNAGMGLVAGSALFGKQSASEQAGSAIGGMLGGSKLVEGALSKGLEKLSAGLGQFAGPLGSVLGGVLGSALGGAFTKVKWGRIDLSAAGVSGTSGNSGSSQKAALAAGNSIYGGLADLASQFGGTIGNFGNISVGVRHGDYRVNAGGTSLKVKKGAVDFNDDAEAAVAYAMKLAIERGAINGIRASTNNLLKAGDDLSAQINKALSFENVFTELKTYLDPVGAELDTIDKEFANLRTIFAEAGATAAEYAQLEQLLSIKRQEALNKETDALNDIRSRIAEAQGDEATATAIARAKELRDATSDAQRALLQQLYAIEDANAAQDKLTQAQEAAATAAEQLRQAWESVSDSLVDEVNRIRGLTGGDDAVSFATLQGRFNEAVLAARGGDQEAAAKLADLSQSLLDVAGNVATSRQELERIKAETAASLEGVIDATKGYAGGSSSASSVSATASTAIDAASAATASTSASGASTDLAAEVRSLRAEVAGLRKDNNTGQSAIINGVNRGAQVLEDVSAEAGGRAFVVSGVAK